MLHSWHERAIDFEQAYDLSAGFKAKSKDKHVLKLLKYLHGLKQGEHDFYEKFKLEVTLPKRSFVQTKLDTCAFCKKRIIVLCCVDDCLTFAQDKKATDNLCHSLKDDFLCTDEGEADGYPGVEIKSENNIMTLRQLQLTKKVIKLLGIDVNNLKSTPVAKPLLNKILIEKIEKIIVSIIDQQLDHYHT